MCLSHTFLRRKQLPAMPINSSTEDELTKMIMVHNRTWAEALEVSGLGLIHYYGTLNSPDNILKNSTRSTA